MSYSPTTERELTNFRGVYQRVSKRKKLSNGAPDTCYYINYTNAMGNQVFEKVGYVSEGYTLEQVNYIRQVRIQAVRHPELFIKESVNSSKIYNNNITIEQAWKLYSDVHLPTLKNPLNIKYDFTKHILPYFKDRKLISISTFEVEEFKSMLLKTLKPSSVKHILVSLFRVFNKMFEWRQISSLDNFKTIKVRHADSKRERVLTPDEVASIFAETKNKGDLYYIIRLSLFTGLRLGEVLKLKIEDIDLDHGIIYLDGKTGWRVA